MRRQWISFAARIDGADAAAARAGTAVAAAVAWLCLGGGTVAHGESVSFNFLTQNDNTSPYNWQSNTQYRTEVTANGDGTVSFKFFNEGGVQSSITDIYFDDYDASPVLKFSTTTPKSPTVSGTTGVKFTVDADSKVAPSDLPGATLADPDFVVTSGMSADADSPVFKNGVNNWTGGTGLGEWVMMTFTLTSGNTFDDVVAALRREEDAWAHLRIGIKVQGFADGGSESFLSKPLPPDTGPRDPPIIPLPGAVWGGMALFGAIASWKVMRRQS